MCATMSLRRPLAKSPSFVVQRGTQPAPASVDGAEALHRAERAHEALHMSRTASGVAAAPVPPPDGCPPPLLAHPTNPDETSPHEHTSTRNRILLAVSM